MSQYFRLSLVTLFALPCAAQTVSINGIPGYSVAGITPASIGAQPAGVAVGSAAPTIPVSTGQSYFVSNTGSDSNNGTSPLTPWQTIAKVNGATLAAGSQVLFQCGNVWHEALTLPSAGTAAAPITVGAYGTCSAASKPIIDGADPVTDWAVQSGTTYQAAYTATAVKGFVDGLYASEAPLTLQTSIANVNSTPGSIYSDGTYVYVNLPDGSSPANHTIEVSPSTRFGVNLHGEQYVIVNGIEVVRTALDGIYDDSGIGHQTVENSTVFNTNYGAPNGSQANGGIRFSGYTYGTSTPTPGIVIQGNTVGRVDVNPTISFLTSGIHVASATGAYIAHNSVATVNTNGISVSDYFDSASDQCDTALIAENDVSNNQSGIDVKGCPGTDVYDNNIHDGYGFGIGVGNGIQQGRYSTGVIAQDNTIRNLGPGFGGANFNGIDTNAGSTVTYLNNKITDVAAACITIEADSAPSSGALIGNLCDQSNGTRSNGLKTGGNISTFYVRDVSLPATTFAGNTFVMSPNYAPGFRIGATSAGDASHDLTLAQFEAAYPGGDVPSLTSSFVQLAGSTMTGPLTLAADPVSAMQAAPMEYVQSQAAAVKALIPGLNYDAKLSGAKGNGRIVTDGAITTGTATLTSSSAAFTAADVGKLIAIKGAGTSGATFPTTISSVTNATTAVLAANAGTTVSGATVTIATDDTASLAALVITVAANGGGTIYLDPGIYGISAPIPWGTKVSMTGAGARVSILKGFGTGINTGFITGTGGAAEANGFTSSYTNPYQDVNLSNFEIDASDTLMSGGTYSVGYKGIYLQYVQRSSIHGLYIHDTYASSIGTDFMEESRIYDNTVEDAGRGTATGGGASGIGIGVGYNQPAESLVISGNTVIGAGTALGRNCIFVENQNSYGTTEAGYTLTNNNVSNCPVGIADAGAMRSIITGNHASLNNVGIAVNSGTVFSGVPGGQALIANNQVYSNLSHGILIDASGTNGTVSSVGYVYLDDNHIYGNGTGTSGAGIALKSSSSAAFPYVRIRGNDIEYNKMPGVYMTGAGGFTDVAILTNTLVNNGQGGAGGGAQYQSGILIQSPVTRGQIMSNVASDTTAKELYGLYVDTAGVMTNTTVRGNDFSLVSTTPIVIAGSMTAPGMGLTGATPALNASAPIQQIILSANATATLSSIAPGAKMTLEICQPASFPTACTGGGSANTYCTLTLPASMHNPQTIGTTAGACSIQVFDAFNTTTMIGELGTVNVAP